jgi:integrase
VTDQRVCVACGRGVRVCGRCRCAACHRRHQRQAAKRPCPGCGRPGYLRSETGRCGTCTRWARPRRPAARTACRACGQLRRQAAQGLCNRCRQRDPDWPFDYADWLAARLQQPPEWLGDFAAWVAVRFSPSRAVGLLRELGRLLTHEPSSPPRLLEAARQRQGRSMGPLARTLEGFFVAGGLALPLDETERLARARRARLLEATPAPLRPAVATFADAQLAARERARRAGTKPRADHTIETSLAVLRDLARFLAAHRPGIGGWELVSTADVERFLAAQPTSRATRLPRLRAFFRFARAQRLIVADPTHGLRASSPTRFHGAVLEPTRQRALYRRWTTRPVHPHEAFVGLMALLHGATPAELRGLEVADLDRHARTARLGRRPHPEPLDPATWQALQRCLAYRAALRTLNPHLLVTRGTASSRASASSAYLTHVLNQARVSARTLRSTRLADLVVAMDPKLVAAAFGMNPDAATRYLPDTVDEARLANL